MDLDIFETSCSDCLKSKNNSIHLLNFESLKYIISTLLDYFCLLFFYDGQFFMKSLMPVNAQYETLILIRLRLFVQHTRARVGHESNYWGHYPRDTAPLKLD